MSKRITISKRGNRYAVLLDGIQVGVNYSSKALAENEAKKLEERYKIK